MRGFPYPSFLSVLPFFFWDVASSERPSLPPGGSLVFKVVEEVEYTLPQVC